jgi:transcriptional regulator with XRE-family HTH domain
MKDIAKRLLEARTKSKRSQQEIARLLDVSKQLVSHWENARSEITVPQIIRLAKILGVSVEWLMIGVGGDLQSSSVRVHTGMGRLVPMVSQDQLLEVARGSLNLEDIKTQHATSMKCSTRSLSFEIFDRSMEPTYQLGHLITVDPEQLPEPGDCVVFALLSENQVLFRRYRPQAESKPAMPPFTLQADNPYFEPRLITPAHQPIYLGRKVEHIIRGPR